MSQTFLVNQKHILQSVLSNSQTNDSYELILESQTYSSRYVHEVQFTNILWVDSFNEFLYYCMYNTEYIVFKKVVFKFVCFLCNLQ